MATKSSGKKSSLTNKQLRYLHAKLDEGGSGGSSGSAAKPKAARKPRAKADETPQAASQRRQFTDEDYAIPRNLTRRDLKQSDDYAISELGDWHQAYRPNSRARREISDSEQLLKKDDPNYEAKASALLDYRSSGYKFVNYSLRTGEESDALGIKSRKPTKEVIESLDRVFAEDARPLSKPLMVMRGVDESFAGELIGQIASGTLAAGSLIEDKAFMSTTQSFKHARDFSQGGEGTLRFDLVAPKGMKGVFMGQDYEGEVLFDRDSRVRVTEVKKDVDGQYVVVGRLE